MKLFDCVLIIRETIPITSALQHYGIAFNNAGFALCPFHSEKTASFSVKHDKFYHCFGCQAHGDIIDFIISRYNLQWTGAIEKLNNDFNLRLPIGRKMSVAESLQLSKLSQQIETERACKAAELKRRNDEYDQLLDECARLDCNLMRLKPKPGETELDPLFVEALCNIEYYKWLIRITPLPERV